MFLLRGPKRQCGERYVLCKDVTPDALMPQHSGARALGGNRKNRYTNRMVHIACAGSFKRTGRSSGYTSIGRSLPASSGGFAWKRARPHAPVSLTSSCIEIKFHTAATTRHRFYVSSSAQSIALRPVLTSACTDGQLVRQELSCVVRSLAGFAVHVASAQSQSPELLHFISLRRCSGNSCSTVVATVGSW